jgi:hypothetical protein
MEPPFNIVYFRQAIAEGNITWRKHVLTKMLERGIGRENVSKVLLHGEIIQVYDYDKPFPSILVLGFPDDYPLHVVASFDEESRIAYIITAYIPDSGIFENDFKTKRK